MLNKLVKKNQNNNFKEQNNFKIKFSSNDKSINGKHSNKYNIHKAIT